MPASERQLVRKAFRHLVTFEGTRAVLERDELLQLLGGGAEVERLIERLIDARLLVSSESDRGTGVVEIVHEALIREWPRLVEWRREDVEGSRFHEQLRSAARQWQDRGRPRGLLWRGDALAEYQLWRRRHATNLTPGEAAFGAASVADAMRGRRIRQAIAAIAIAVTAVFVAALWRANLAANGARDEAEALLRDSYFEQGRLRMLEGDKLGAITPLATAYRRGRTDTPTRLLLEEAARPTRARLFALASHTDKLWDVAYSPDGKWLATASTDRTSRIWDAETGALRATISHAERGNAVAWSSDSRFLASSSLDRTVQVWDVVAGREVVRLPAGINARWIAFNRDASVLVTASPQRVKLWRIPDGAPAGELEDPHRQQIVGATFCEDGACIVTWDVARVVVWDTATLAQRASYQHRGEIATVAVARTGAMLAIGTRSGELVLVRGDGSLIASRAAHDDGIFDLAISPDQTLVVTGSKDRTARLWSAAGELRGILAGHRANVTRVRFTPAGDRVVTTSADNTARVWSTSGMLVRELIGHRNLIMMAAVRPDGTRLATASWDHTAIVWDLTRTQELRPILTARGGASPAVAFAPDGRRIAVGRADGAMSVVDVDTGAVACTTPAAAAIVGLLWMDREQIAVLRSDAGHVIELWSARRCAVESRLPHPAPIMAVSAHSESRLVTAAGDTVRVWRGGRALASFTGYQGAIEGVGADGDDVYVVTNEPVAIVVDAIGDPARRRTFRAGTKAINDVRFDRPRGQLAAASWDQFLYVWDLATGAIVRKLEGSGPLWRARTSPDGSIVIGAGGISPVVWDRTSGAKLTQLEGHADLVTGGEFLDDRIFVTQASNHTAIVWDVAAAQPLMRFDDVAAMLFADDRRAVALIGATGVRVWSPRAPVPDLGALPGLPASPASPAR